jgi:hypothetical protein
MRSVACGQARDDGWLVDGAATRLDGARNRISAHAIDQRCDPRLIAIGQAAEIRCACRVPALFAELSVAPPSGWRSRPSLRQRRQRTYRAGRGRCSRACFLEHLDAHRGLAGDGCERGTAQSLMADEITARGAFQQRFNPPEFTAPAYGWRHEPRPRQPCCRRRNVRPSAHMLEEWVILSGRGVAEIDGQTKVGPGDSGL